MINETNHDIGWKNYYVLISKLKILCALYFETYESE